MASPFIGEIRMFAGNFAPRGFALCDGQLLQVTDNEALFALLGTIYGGDGRTTFALPDLRGRVPIHYGQGPGLSNRPIGQKSGAEDRTITASNLPSHKHTPVKASTATANQTSPTGHVMASPDKNLYRDSFAPPQSASFNAAMISTTGSNPEIDLMAPYQTIHFIIALFGIFPSRN